MQYIIYQIYRIFISVLYSGRIKAIKAENGGDQNNFCPKFMLIISISRDLILKYLALCIWVNLSTLSRESITTVTV